MASGQRPLRLAVAGADHLHLFEIIDGLINAGVETAAHVPDGDLLPLYEGWRAESEAARLDTILERADIDLVITAGVPSRRADIATAAIAAGKQVLSDKPGVTTREQLSAIESAIGDQPGRPWTVLFTERFGNRAIAEAVRRAGAGDVGRVRHVIGAAPHSMFAEQRPDWFWDPASSGGIIADIGTHQIDQFLAITGSTRDAGVLSATVGNVASRQHPRMQDIGRFTLACNGIIGDHRVDYLTAAGLGTWGDVRLTIVGTEGTLEARANVDPAGLDGPEHLIAVDAEGTRRIPLDDVRVDWAELVVADLTDRGERLMTQQHVLGVCDLALEAQSRASDWHDMTEGVLS